MKKSMKTIGTIVTVSIMLVGAYLLGTTQGKATTQPQTASEATYSQQRVMTGNYHDYMVIETIDGNDWLLDDSEESPYIENGVAIFEDGELVQVVFDTMGTETVTDDVILAVRSICKEGSWQKGWKILWIKQ